ncbi:MAG: anti-sigma factor [Betaproteobacteria bacterium]|nr:anti-sigma factor [Betaproteobacteria bacterium]
MRYRDPELRDRLAAEYVLGTMSARARARFKSLLKYDAGLRGVVAQWETRLSPLANAAPAVEPPARLWQGIESRIRPQRRAPGFWNALGFWRSLAAAGITAALVVAIFLGGAPATDPPVDMVAVMTDKQSAPAMMVLWPQQKTKEYPYLRVQAVYPPQILPGTSLELWMLPTGSAPPVSLGLVNPAEATQLVKMKAALARTVGEAWGVALSMEPQGGSPTGKPTTGFLYEGQCVKVM